MILDVAVCGVRCVVVVVVVAVVRWGRAGCQGCGVVEGGGALRRVSYPHSQVGISEWQRQWGSGRTGTSGGLDGPWPWVLQTQGAQMQGAFKWPLSVPCAHRDPRAKEKWPTKRGCMR